MQQDIVEGFRLSPQQKRLWLLQQTDGSLPYRARCAVTIHGALNAEILEQALRTVIARHEILRTSFQLLPGISIPVQVISDDSVCALARHDISSLGVDDQRARIESLYRAVGWSESDCQQLPLVRGVI